MKSKFDTLFNKISFEDLLDTLSKFKYGCLYNDGELTTDIDKIEERDGTDIIVQSSESFFKNEIGMCHDASVCIDEFCRNNDIEHKCIYLASNIAPTFKTHSFVVVKLKDRWQVIDAFSTKTCICGEEYDSYANAIDERIEEWIEKDNDGNDDLETYIADRMPVGDR